MFSQPPQLVDGKLPVFVFPSNLTFYSDDQSTHKQVLSLYNPYEFSLGFKVLCTAPKKYTVVDAEGTIKKGCVVDIVIRHTDICINNEGVKDKFRIQVAEHGQRKVIGKKDIQAVLLPKKDGTAQLADDDFLSLPQQTRDTQQSRRISQQGKIGAVNSTAASSPSFVVVLTALSCIIALMMPLHGDTETRLPDYLHLSFHQKLIAAYILGLVTMVILHL